MKKFWLLLTGILLLYGCEFIVFVSHTEVPAPDFIRDRAFYAAEAYVDEYIEYDLGGDETIYVPPYDSRALDCSGLVINVYNYAVTDTIYNLPFDDKTADEIDKEYSYSIDEPETGDLMVWTDNGEAFHIAIYWKTEDGYYYFLESNDPVELKLEGLDGTRSRRLSVNTNFNIHFRRMMLIEIS